MQAAENVDPWGDEREDYRTAIATALLASVMSLSAKPIDPADILKVLALPQQDVKPEKQEFVPPHVQAEMMQAIFGRQ